MIYDSRPVSYRGGVLLAGSVPLLSAQAPVTALLSLSLSLSGPHCSPPSFDIPVWNKLFFYAGMMQRFNPMGSTHLLFKNV